MDGPIGPVIGMVAAMVVMVIAISILVGVIDVTDRGEVVEPEEVLVLVAALEVALEAVLVAEDDKSDESLIE